MFVKKNFAEKSGVHHISCSKQQFRGLRIKAEGYLLRNDSEILAAHRFYEKNGFESVSIDELPKSFPVLQVDKKFYRYIV